MSSFGAWTLLGMGQRLPRRQSIWNRRDTLCALQSSQRGHSKSTWRQRGHSRSSGSWARRHHQCCPWECHRTGQPLIQCTAPWYPSTGPRPQPHLHSTTLRPWFLGTGMLRVVMRVSRRLGHGKGGRYMCLRRLRCCRESVGSRGRVGSARNSRTCSGPLECIGERMLIDDTI